MIFLTLCLWVCEYVCVCIHIHEQMHVRLANPLMLWHNGALLVMQL